MYKIDLNRQADISRGSQNLMVLVHKLIENVRYSTRFFMKICCISYSLRDSKKEYFIEEFSLSVTFSLLCILGLFSFFAHYLQ